MNVLPHVYIQISINFKRLSWALIILRYNGASRSKLQGIKAKFAEANPPSLKELRRVRLTIHPCSKLQDILAKANKGPCYFHKMSLKS